MTGARSAVWSWWLAAVVCSALSVSAWAGARSYGSVDVSVELPDAAGTAIGYRAASVVLTNNGAATREIRLEFPANTWNYSYGDFLRSVSRSFRVEAGQTLRAEMLLPPLPINGDDVTVFIDGGRQRETVDLQIRSHHRSGSTRIAVLMSRNIGREVRDGFSAAAERRLESLQTLTGGSGFGRTRGRGLSWAEVSIVLGEPVAQWSPTWKTYSPYGAVVVSEQDVRTMPAAVAAALRAYVLDGGLLQVVMSSEGRPAPASWPQDFEQTQPNYGPFGLEVQPLGLGRMNWVPEDFVIGWGDNASDGWIEAILDRGDRLTKNMTAEQADRSLPVIEDLQTPVRGLLAVMAVFALVIGPANVVVLTLINRRMWLLWTVPVIAAVFSGVVVVYALVSEGVTPTARTQAVTWLDQTTRESVTVAMRGYYAPLTPGDGLRFGMETAVIPQVGLGENYYYEGGGGGRSIDLTTGQHLSRGWVSARVPAYFELRSVETRRERLDFERLDDGGLAVVNGLGVDVESLQAVDDDGLVWRLETLAAGQRGVLEAGPNLDALNGEDHHVNWDGFGRLALDPTGPIAGPRGWQFGGHGRVRGTARPGTYVARTAGCPFVVDGLSGLGEHRVAATVVGVWKEAP